MSIKLAEYLLPKILVGPNASSKNELRNFLKCLLMVGIKAPRQICTGCCHFLNTVLPPFTIEPPNKVIFLNSSGESVHCAALGNPRPSISWVLADGTAVTDLPGLRLSLANGTLLFLPFMAESYRQDIHASTYRCIASNLVGKISSRDIRVRAEYGK
ncbi:down syndrome cell adhesion molecule-like protein Dscam2 [Caerostris extrusa]|uniref:Down syndrome cell adhesion molecule-like protein Dscam2 n=1 Tax=Caerostris extrusa TaxID=172846 RepID=A0AAV4M4W6_CAEEX|nr:down syndrome cell adhesion molecule-like protein Dscam2 [Caerostris extrusa]